MSKNISQGRTAAPDIPAGGRISAAGAAALSRPVHTKSLGRRLADNWQMYALLLIPVVLTVVYK